MDGRLRPVDGPDGGHFEGIRGTPPDLYARIRWCREHGRRVFRETILVAGRRSSKTFNASIVSLWQVSQLLGLGDPQGAFGLPAGKQITLVAMSTNRDATSRDVFGDLVGMVQTSEVFDGSVEHIGSDTIRFWTPAQLAAGARERGERGLIVLSALPTTASSARGPAVYGSLIDEAAHLGGLGPTSTTTEIHRTLAPAMAQFPTSFTLMCSSPWTMIGRFYEAHRSACEIDPATGRGRTLDAFTLQIPSWELYLDWDRAATIEMWPGGPVFGGHDRPAIEAASRTLQVERQRDPASYLVEFEGQWATVSDRYLPASSVDAIFAPLGDRHFEPTTTRIYGLDYTMHIDLSLSGDNTALVLAHREAIDGAAHVVVDQMIVWQPGDYANGQVDYVEIADTAVRLAIEYEARITIDQYQSMAMIDKIASRLDNAPTRSQRATSYKPTVIHANATEKLERWELVKTCAAEGRLHAPFDRHLHDELSFLRRVDRRIEAPTSGPVTTDDAADALSHVVMALANGTPPARQFGDLHAIGGSTAWNHNSHADAFSSSRRSRTDTTVSRPERGRQYRR